MIFFLALRNLLRNSKNTFIITLLIMIITALFFIGNSILSDSNRKLKQTYSRNFTGDIVIKMKSTVSMSIFGANTPAIGEFFTIPVIKNYDKIISLLHDCEEIASYTSQVSGGAIADIKARHYRCLLLGIDARNYFSLFNGITLVKGHLLEPGERGGMITSAFADMIERESKKKLNIGDPILLNTFGRMGFKIREVPLAGIYTYTDIQLPMDSLILTDPQTLRALNSIMIGNSSDYTPPKETTDILTDDLDSLFGETKASEESKTDTSISIYHIRSLLLEENNSPPVGWEGGNWNFIILQLKPGRVETPVIKKLNRLLAPLEAEAVDWRTAAGTSALLVLLLQLLFNGGFFLVMIAGIIGIINILLISIFRRTKEIGTLRAIGARDSYILRLIFTENLILSFFAGILGIVLGSVLISFVNGARIPLTNTMLASLMGQQILAIDISLSLALISLVTSLGLGFISSLYPVWAALSIEPIVAVRKG